MHEFSDYRHLSELIEENGDVLTVRMLELRNAHGADRLGVIVRENIAKELRSNGLGHVPEDLPSSQWDHALIYRLGTPISDLVNAIIKPQPDTDDVIRHAVESKAQRTLDKIRELLEV